jgi:uncharacterized membrane protein
MEAVIVATSVAILGFYHLGLARRLRTQPETTTMGRHRLARSAWVRLRKGADRELVIVQAMRNLIMSATFLASTAVLLAAGFLGAVSTTDKLSTFAHSLNFVGVESLSLWLFKALLLAVNFFVVFFNFSLAIRSFNHIWVMAPCEQDGKAGEEEVADEMERGALHYALGMRGFYISIPLILWLFGPIWLLTGTVLLVMVLRRID